MASDDRAAARYSYKRRKSPNEEDNDNHEDEVLPRLPTRKHGLAGQPYPSNRQSCLGAGNGTACPRRSTAQQPQPTRTTDAGSAESLEPVDTSWQDVCAGVENSAGASGAAAGHKPWLAAVSAGTRNSPSSAKPKSTRNRRRGGHRSETQSESHASTESKRLPERKIAQDSDKENTHTNEINHGDQHLDRKKNDAEVRRRGKTKGKDCDDDVDTDSRDLDGGKLRGSVNRNGDREKEDSAERQRQASNITAEERPKHTVKAHAAFQYDKTKSESLFEDEPHHGTSNMQARFNEAKNNNSKASKNTTNVHDNLKSASTSRSTWSAQHHGTRKGIKDKEMILKEDAVSFLGHPMERNGLVKSSTSESIATPLAPEMSSEWNRTTTHQKTKLSIKTTAMQPEETRAGNAAEESVRQREMKRRPDERRPPRVQQAHSLSAPEGFSEKSPPGAGFTTIQNLPENVANQSQGNTKIKHHQAVHDNPALQDSGAECMGSTQNAEEREHRQSRATSERPTLKTLARSFTHRSHPDTTKQGLEKAIKDFTNQTFPDTDKRTYFVPPILFNMSKRALSTHVPGCYTQELSPQSNSRAEEAVERLLQTLREVLTEKIWFSISGLTFDEYLNKLFAQKDPGQPRKKLKIPLPKPGDLPPQYRRGEIDVLLINKAHGLIIIDVKAVGDTFDELNMNEREKAELVKKVLVKALCLMRKEKDVVLHLVGDITCTVPVSTMLVLPNLRRPMLKTALDSDPGLREALTQCLRNPAEDFCLCADDLPDKHQAATDNDVTRLSQWWDRYFPDKPPVLEEGVYEQIIGRFCGPLSTLSVWTAQTPRTEIRTLGQAVRETGHRFSTVVLLPQQSEVLGCMEKRVYLVGPPGSGKTLLLALRGVQWVREGCYVSVLTAKAGPSPVALVIFKQIQDTLNQYSDNKAEQGEVQTDTILSATDFPQMSGSTFIGRLKARAKGRPVCLIVDELHGEVVPLLRRIIQKVPDCTIWCAGAWPATCPSGFVRKELSTSVRCPPAVQTLLKMVEPSKNGSDVSLTSSTEFKYVTHSTEIPELPLPTTGVRVHLMSHDGHHTPQILDCAACAKELAAYLKKELRVGEDIPAEDVLILTADTYALSKTCPGSGLQAGPAFARELRNLDLDVEVITHFTGRERQLAFAPSNKITMTSFQFVVGLERKVVVFLPEGAPLNTSGVDTVTVEPYDSYEGTNVLPSPESSASAETVLTKPIVNQNIQTTGDSFVDDDAGTSGHEAGPRNDDNVTTGAHNDVTNVTSGRAVVNATKDEAPNGRERDGKTERKVSHKVSHTRRLRSSKNDFGVAEDVDEQNSKKPGDKRTLSESSRSPQPQLTTGNTEEDDHDADHHQRYANDWNRGDYCPKARNQCTIGIVLRSDVTLKIENHSDDEEEDDVPIKCSDEKDAAETIQQMPPGAVNSSSLDVDINTTDSTEADEEKQPVGTGSGPKDSAEERDTADAADSTSVRTTTTVATVSKLSSGTADDQTVSSDAAPTIAGPSTSLSTQDHSDAVSEACAGVSINPRGHIAGKDGERDQTKGETRQSYDSRLRAAVEQLTVTNRQRMWYAVSRSLGHAVVFHFRNQ